MSARLAEPKTDSARLSPIGFTPNFTHVEWELNSLSGPKREPGHRKLADCVIEAAPLDWNLLPRSQRSAQCSTNLRSIPCCTVPGARN